MLTTAGANPPARSAGACDDGTTGEVTSWAKQNPDGKLIPRLAVESRLDLVDGYQHLVDGYQRQCASSAHDFSNTHRSAIRIKVLRQLAQ
jgi:hypothetical protein